MTNKIHAFARAALKDEPAAFGYALVGTPQQIKHWIHDLVMSRSEVTKSGTTLYFNVGPMPWAMSFAREADASAVFSARPGKSSAAMVDVALSLD